MNPMLAINEGINNPFSNIRGEVTTSNSVSPIDRTRYNTLNRVVILISSSRSDLEMINP